jgi:subtilase family serine protease
VVAGGKFNLTDTVFNQGQAAAGASTARYHLSVDATKSAGDVLLIGTRSVVSLAPGTASTGSRSVTVPSVTPAGIYYVLACADDLAKVGESDNTNNCMASAVTLTVH